MGSAAERSAFPENPRRTGTENGLLAKPHAVIGSKVRDRARRLLDIAGYSNLVLDQQIELTCKPNKIARCAPQFRLGWGGGDTR